MLTPMGKTVDRIMSEALGLPANARAFVAEKLLESLDAIPGEPISDAWREEVRKRCREIDEGRGELIDADTVFSEAYAKLG